ncbi:hypothetical protein [Adlercreutzia equolifaciens]|uniref:hypothetical protein n=1 Tax=Adlercreutzia equolifaciens TaxID=446660 RepID=UPI001CC45E99|nr:hypothetical protein [Adlercreutzia equolifaciens]GJC77110.1 hypothetical protein Aeq9CBH6_24450 [Adlercreutzia equolifaciens]
MELLLRAYPQATLLDTAIITMAACLITAILMFVLLLYLTDELYARGQVSERLSGTNIATIIGIMLATAFLYGIDALSIFAIPLAILILLLVLRKPIAKKDLLFLYLFGLLAYTAIPQAVIP